MCMCVYACVCVCWGAVGRVREVGEDMGACDIRAGGAKTARRARFPPERDSEWYGPQP